MAALGSRLGRGPLVISLLVVALAISMYLSQVAYSDADGSDGAAGHILLDEDFQQYQMGDLPVNWTVESAGYGMGAIYVETLVFEPGNNVLHVMSASNSRAVVTHNVSVEMENISVCLSVKVTEKEQFPEIDDPVAVAVGFESLEGRKVPLVRLGRSDNQTVIPFGKWYSQDAWLPICAWVNLRDGTASVYIWQRLVGKTQIANLSATEVRSVYLLLGGGAWYEGRFDNIVVREYPIVEGLGPLGLSTMLFLALRALYTEREK